MEKLENSNFENNKNYYEAGSINVQICPKCGEPLFPPEAIHECGNLEKILKESRDKEGKTLYPQIEHVFQKAKETFKNANGNARLLNFDLTSEVIKKLEELHDNV